ncbi:MAG TPA: alpha/beta hydrolase [Solirubrobacteraceae bacterium]|nr:alpha/beta hydrolase [Solirubrobacteraceae bacterium]
MGAHEATALHVPVADGRELDVVLYGPDDGVPIVVHHGTPGVAGLFDSLIEVGARRGLRHITYSRPGYGGSTRHPGRSVADCAADVVAIVDVLGHDRFHSIGGSGGAPHSIACAALLPDRVISAAAIATPAPLDAAGLDWTAGMGAENIEEIAAVRASDRALQQYLEGEATEMDGVQASQIAAVLGDVVCEADRRVITGRFAEWMAEDSAKSLAAGVWGWFDDDRALFRDWGFDLSEIGAPLTLWHGEEDRFVPVAHGEWMAARTGAKAELRPGEGHLSLAISSYGEILDRLLDSAPLRQ